MNLGLFPPGCVSDPCNRAVSAVTMDELRVMSAFMAVLYSIMAGMYPSSVDPGAGGGGGAGGSGGNGGNGPSPPAIAYDPDIGNGTQWVSPNDDWQAPTDPMARVWSLLAEMTSWTHMMDSVDTSHASTLNLTDSAMMQTGAMDCSLNNGVTCADWMFSAINSANDPSYMPLGQTAVQNLMLATNAAVCPAMFAPSQTACSATCTEKLTGSLSGPLGCCALSLFAFAASQGRAMESGPAATSAAPVTPVLDALSGACLGTSPAAYCPATPPGAVPTQLIGVQLSALVFAGATRSAAVTAAVTAAIAADVAGHCFVDRSSISVNNLVAGTPSGTLVTLAVNGASNGVTASILAVLRGSLGNSSSFPLLTPSLGRLLQSDPLLVNSPALSGSPFTMSASEAAPVPYGSQSGTGGSGGEVQAVADGSGGISDATVSAIASILGVAFIIAGGALIYKRFWDPKQHTFRLGDDGGSREVSSADAAPIAVASAAASRAPSRTAPTASGASAPVVRVGGRSGMQQMVEVE